MRSGISLKCNSAIWGTDDVTCKLSIPPFRVHVLRRSKIGLDVSGVKGEGPDACGPLIIRVELAQTEFQLAVPRSLLRASVVRGVATTPVRSRAC
ncbi:hypothetical protein Zmor_009568 [Zophobas morio]|uniref:Uncharacterized protein n=1 Tax=Zophobas morio TaxID=2755281 RepID=A0AA38MIS3_9CUCU|nr:hypothetical protein Zmor_009568 [Zophobas morio]